MEVNIVKFYKVKYYQIVMMSKRGYIISDVESSIIKSSPEKSMQNFLYHYLERATTSKTVIEAQLNNTYTHSKNSKDTLRVLYIDTTPDEKQIKKDKKDQILDTIENDKQNKHFILISEVKFTPANFKELSELNESSSSDPGLGMGYWLEFFLYQELLYDPTVHHLLQPQIRILTFNESRDYLRQRKKDADHLQKYCIDDPVIKFLGGRGGQVAMIQRKIMYNSQVTESLDDRLITNSSIYEEPKKKI